MLNFNLGDKITLYRYYYDFSEDKVIIEPIECIVWEVTKPFSSEPILEEAIFRIEKEAFPSVNLTYKYPKDFQLDTRKGMLSFKDNHEKKVQRTIGRTVVKRKRRIYC